MSKGNTFETDSNKLIYNATAITNLAQNGVSPIGSIQIGLHTSDPGEGGNETTNECSYSGYARLALSRSSGTFSCSGANVSLQGVQFFARASGSQTATHFHTGTASSGTGKIFHSGTITPNLIIISGVVPMMRQTTIITED